MVRLGQTEEAADGVEQCGGNGRVVVGRGREEAAPREVEELVAEPRHGSRDRRPVRVAQVGARGEEAVELATQLGLGAAAELADQGGGARRCGGDAERTAAPPPMIVGVLAGGSRWVEGSC